MTPLIVLGSGSPRRRMLLEQYGLAFQVILPTEPVDETPQPNERPADLVKRLSRLKATAVAATIGPSPPRFSSPTDVPPSVIIITADTTVALGQQILNKPHHEAEARWMLKALREQPHQVYTGMTVGHWSMADLAAPLKLITRLHESTVRMRPYSDAEIEAYIASGDPFDKAGAYAIQSKSFNPVAQFEGCYTSIMGLPLGQLAATLSEFGIVVPPISGLGGEFSCQCCQTA